MKGPVARRPFRVSRRSFLKLGGATGAVLAVGFKFDRWLGTVLMQKSLK
mgnify:CR=1 FL=1